MYARPGWALRAANRKLTAISPVPDDALPIVHELIEQNIQGGSADQHYHLTAAEHAFVVSGRFEPATIVCENLYDITGDIVLMASAI